MFNRRILNTKILKIYKNSKTFNTLLFKKFCGTIDDPLIPIINIDKFLKKSQGWEVECKIAAECLHETGIMIIKDPVLLYILNFYLFLSLKFFLFISKI